MSCVNGIGDSCLGSFDLLADAWTVCHNTQVVNNNANSIVDKLHVVPESLLVSIILTQPGVNQSDTKVFTQLKEIIGHGSTGHETSCRVQDELGFELGLGHVEGVDFGG